MIVGSGAQQNRNKTAEHGDLKIVKNPPNFVFIWVF